MLGSFTLSHFYYLLDGMVWTIILSLLAFVLGGIAGFFVMLTRISENKYIRWVSLVYVQVLQGIPLLVILFLVYYGLGVFGWGLPALIAAGVALMFYVSAFLAEIWRGCVESVVRTQWEAAECLALTRAQTLRLVIIPQSIRISLPPTIGFLVQVLKGTSLASVIGFVELTRAGQIVNNSIFQPFLIFLLVGAFYFVLCYPLSRWSRYMENKLNVGSR